MGVSSNTLPQETVVEEKPAIGESRSASTDGQPNGQVADAKEDPEVKATAEQATSLKDYFVCLAQQMPFDVLMRPYTNGIQRVLSYTTTGDRVVLAIALICSIGSGVVRFMLHALSNTDGDEINVESAVADHEYRLWWIGWRIQFILYPGNYND
jgi:hypothetical protein